MQNLLKTLRSSMLVLIPLLFLVSGIYPMIVWGLSQVFFPYEANGSLLKNPNNQIIGSELIGQPFASPHYFHTRPSAAGHGYDAASSSGSNLGPISHKLLHGMADDPSSPDKDESFMGIEQRVRAYRETNQLAPGTLVPADAVTASASGLDPHISPRNAELQVPRVAKSRGISKQNVQLLVKRATEAPDLFFLGEPRINVVKLNLALDQISDP